jgi:hypothetical protein
MPLKTLGMASALASRSGTLRPACDLPATDACVRRCTTRQSKTRISEVKEVCYPWHPWHGNVVLIVGLVERRDRAAYSCRLDEDAVGPSLEVPCWMFDRALCCRFRLAEAAGVGCEELLQLRALLRRLRSGVEDSAVEDQHRSLPKKGDADEQDPSPVSVRTTQSVSAEATASDMEVIAERDPAENPATSGSPHEHGSRPKRRGRLGGGR